MGVKRRYPLMINDAPTSKIRKPNTLDYGPIIHELAGDDIVDDDLDYEDADEDPVVVQQRGQGSQREAILEIPNTPSSTKSHHEEVDDLDEENAQVDEMIANQMIDELNGEAEKVEQRRKSQKRMSESSVGEVNTPLVLRENERASEKSSVQQKDTGSRVTRRRVAATSKNNDDDEYVTVNVIKQEPKEHSKVQPEIDPNEFMEFDSLVNAGGAAAASTSAAQLSSSQQQEKSNWYANKEDFISNEMPNELFEDDQQPGSSGMMNAEVNLGEATFDPTLSEDIFEKMDKAEKAESSKKESRNKKQLTLARFNSNKLSNDEILGLHTP